MSLSRVVEVWNDLHVSGVGEACGCAYVAVHRSQSAAVRPKQSEGRILRVRVEIGRKVLKLGRRRLRVMARKLIGVRVKGRREAVKLWRRPRLKFSRVRLGMLS